MYDICKVIAVLYTYMTKAWLLGRHGMTKLRKAKTKYVCVSDFRPYTDSCSDPKQTTKTE